VKVAAEVSGLKPTTYKSSARTAQLPATFIRLMRMEPVVLAPML
jgi:hypothetical protein